MTDDRQTFLWSRDELEPRVSAHQRAIWIRPFPPISPADIAVIVHFSDDPAMQGLTLPEDSHLSRGCAAVFTDAYVRAIAQLTPRLTLRADAPAPLSAADCTRHR